MWSFQEPLALVVSYPFDVVSTTQATQKKGMNKYNTRLHNHDGSQRHSVCSSRRRSLESLPSAQSGAKRAPRPAKDKKGFELNVVLRITLLVERRLDSRK